MTMIERKGIYLRTVEQNIPKLLNFQNADGCFYYPYWKEKKCNYINARWQEAVAPLAWYYAQKTLPELLPRIEKGIDLWCKIQNANGCFPEVSKHDQSFSATAFSFNAICYAIQKIGLRERWVPSLQRAAEWLGENDEVHFSNQELAAALALLRAGILLGDQNFSRHSSEKLLRVLRDQRRAGHYLEKGGFDFGYSSLSFNLLAQYHRLGKGDLLPSAKKYCKYILNADLAKVHNTRGTVWCIVNGFEYFASMAEECQSALLKILYQKNLLHLPDDRHLCTDLLWYGEASQNVKAPFSGTILFNEIIYPEQKRSRLIDLLRPLGIHRLRKYKDKLDCAVSRQGRI